MKIGVFADAKRIVTLFVILYSVELAAVVTDLGMQSKTLQDTLERLDKLSPEEDMRLMQELVAEKKREQAQEAAEALVETRRTE